MIKYYYGHGQNGHFDHDHFKNSKVLWSMVMVMVGTPKVSVRKGFFLKFVFPITYKHSEHSINNKFNGSNSLSEKY
jgi:hypothetical protein